MMPKYVMLINWTDLGARDSKDTVARVKQAMSLFEFLGGTVDTVLWTQGRYDVVAIGEAPDDETVASFTIRLASHGHVRTETLRGFSEIEMERILNNVG